MVLLMGESALSWWPAPAKINLFLRVLGRRSDGYHDIQTLFQLLDWGDEIGIRITDEASISRKAVSYGVAESEDLVVKAANLLQREAACRRGAVIEVRKNVPAGSGMGGGSSDAATVLLVLNRLWECGLDNGTLCALGRRLGADVPVFVQGRTALAQGIGDDLAPVSLGRRHYVLVFPGVHISTADVFSDPGLKRDSQPCDQDKALSGGGRNDCEAVVRERFPRFRRAMQALEQWGEPHMTGTGSGIFIPMNDEKSAKSAAQSIKSLYNVRAVQGVDISPLHAKLDC
jgi:4-diphosphocytidyl-2-C-methyl-D-erythritol kinase